MAGNAFYSITSVEELTIVDLASGARFENTLCLNRLLFPLKPAVTLT